MLETGLNNLFFQVLHWLWHVPVLRSWHRTWLAGRHRAIQVHWALLGICWQTKATMANFSCTSSTWLFIMYQLCRRRIIWGTNGEGEPSNSLAEIQGGHCCVWPCAQLWKDMPRIPGLFSNYFMHSYENSILDCFESSLANIEDIFCDFEMSNKLLIYRI